MIETIKRLLKAFPFGIINHSFEFVADPNPRVNSYFCLGKCETSLDVCCKVLEYLSRDSCVSMHYSIQKRNEEVWDYHLGGINRFLGTNFTRKEMESVYAKFGNGIRHEECKDFILRGFPVGMLYE